MRKWLSGSESQSAQTHLVQFSSVQLLSCVRLFVIPWTAACHASLSINNSRSLLKPMSLESVMPSNLLILCCPFLLLPSIFTSIRVFSIESVLCIRWPKYWSFRFNISPSNEYSGLISFRIDCLDLLVVQGTLRVGEDMSLWSGVYFLWIQVHFLLPLKYKPRSLFSKLQLEHLSFGG